MRKRPFRIETTNVVVLVLSITCWTDFADESKPDPFLKPEGYVESGSVFGIRVGETEQHLSKEILEGWRYNYTENGGNCGLRRYPENVKLRLYSDDSWRSGALCIAIRNGKVISIQWIYQPFTM